MAKKKNKSKSGASKGQKPSSSASASSQQDAARNGGDTSQGNAHVGQVSSSSKPKTKSAPKAAAKKAAAKKATAHPGAVAIAEVFDSGNYAAIRKIAATIEAGTFPGEIVAASTEAKSRVQVDPVVLGIGVAGVLFVLTIVLLSLTPAG